MGSVFHFVIFDTVVLLRCLIILAYELIFPWRYGNSKRQCKWGKSGGQTVNSDEFKKLEKREGRKRGPMTDRETQPPESQSPLLCTPQKPSQVKTSLSVPVEKQQEEEAVLRMQATALRFGSGGKGSGKVSI